MARPCATDLSTRSDQVELTGYSAGLVFAKLLDAEAQEGAWRLVELFSMAPSGGRPFEARLFWSAGQGAGASAWITITRSTRVCVFARSLRVQVANLHDGANRVGVTIADAYASTRNQWEARSQGVDATPVEIEIPPFATHFRVELADSTLLNTTHLRVYDGTDTLRSHHLADRQPEDGFPLGSARRLTLTVGSNPYFRTIFKLSL